MKGNLLAPLGDGSLWAWTVTHFKINIKIVNHFFFAGAFPPLAPFAASASNSSCFAAHVMSSSGVLMQAPSITTFSTTSSP